MAAASAWRGRRGALIALAVWIPSLLAQDYCRSMAFRLRRPDQALTSDVSFAAVQVVGSVSPWPSGSAASPCTSACGAPARRPGHCRMSCSTAPRGARGWALPAALWPRSRWFLAEFSTAFPADQGYLLLLPVLLGTAQFGLYRAGTGLVGPVVVVLIAGGNIGLPESVRRLQEGGVGLSRTRAG